MHRTSQTAEDSRQSGCPLPQLRSLRARFCRFRARRSGGEVRREQNVAAGIDLKLPRPAVAVERYRERIHVEPLATVGHDHELVSPAIRQRLPEPGRNAEPTLRVDRVAVMSSEQLPPRRGGKAPV